jgi:hypothetical protein
VRWAKKSKRGGKPGRKVNVLILSGGALNDPITHELTSVLKARTFSDGYGLVTIVRFKENLSHRISKRKIIQ